MYETILHKKTYLSRMRPSLKIQIHIQANVIVKEKIEAEVAVVIVVEVIAEVKDKGALVLPGCCSPLGKGQAGTNI